MVMIGTTPTISVKCKVADDSLVLSAADQVCSTANRAAAIEDDCAPPRLPDRACPHRQRPSEDADVGHDARNCARAIQSMIRLRALSVVTFSVPNRGDDE